MLTLSAVPAATNAGGIFPAEVGDVHIVKGDLLQRSGLVLDAQGTVHLLTLQSHGESFLLRVSGRGAATEMIIHRGWPFIIDKAGRLRAFDTSPRTGLKNKLPYIAARSLRTIPWAAATGTVLYLVSATSTLVEPTNALVSGVLIYYGLDIARTSALMSHRQIGRGGDFFTHVLASNVRELRPDPEEGDYRVVPRDGPSKSLNHLAAAFGTHNSCTDFLVRMNQR